MEGQPQGEAANKIQMGMDDIYAMLHSATVFGKLARNGAVDNRAVLMAPNNQSLHWASGSKSASETTILINGLVAIVEGQHTPNFTRMSSVAAITKQAPWSLSVLFIRPPVGPKAPSQHEQNAQLLALRTAGGFVDKKLMPGVVSLDLISPNAYQHRLWLLGLRGWLAAHQAVLEAKIEQEKEKLEEEAALKLEGVPHAIDGAFPVPQPFEQHPPSPQQLQQQPQQIGEDGGNYYGAPAQPYEPPAAFSPSASTSSPAGDGVAPVQFLPMSPQSAPILSASSGSAQQQQARYSDPPPAHFGAQSPAAASVVAAIEEEDGAAFAAAPGGVVSPRSLSHAHPQQQQQMQSPQPLPEVFLPSIAACLVEMQEGAEFCDAELEGDVSMRNIRLTPDHATIIYSEHPSIAGANAASAALLERRIPVSTVRGLVLEDGLAVAVSPSGNNHGSRYRGSLRCTYLQSLDGEHDEDDEKKDEEEARNLSSPRLRPLHLETDNRFILHLFHKGLKYLSEHPPIAAAATPRAASLLSPQHQPHNSISISNHSPNAPSHIRQQSASHVQGPAIQPAAVPVAAVAVAAEVAVASSSSSSSSSLPLSPPAAERAPSPIAADHRFRSASMVSLPSSSPLLAPPAAAAAQPSAEPHTPSRHLPLYPPISPASPAVVVSPAAEAVSVGSLPLQPPVPVDEERKEDAVYPAIAPGVPAVAGPRVLPSDLDELIRMACAPELGGSPDWDLILHIVSTVQFKTVKEANRILEPNGVLAGFLRSPDHTSGLLSLILLEALIENVASFSSLPHLINDAGWLNVHLIKVLPRWSRKPLSPWAGDSVFGFLKAGHAAERKAWLAQRLEQQQQMPLLRWNKIKVIVSSLAGQKKMGKHWFKAYAKLKANRAYDHPDAVPAARPASLAGAPAGAAPVAGAVGVVAPRAASASVSAPPPGLLSRDRAHFQQRMHQASSALSLLADLMHAPFHEHEDDFAVALLSCETHSRSLSSSIRQATSSKKSDVPQWVTEEMVASMLMMQEMIEGAIKDARIKNAAAREQREQEPLNKQLEEQRMQALQIAGLVDPPSQRAYAALQEYKLEQEEKAYSPPAYQPSVAVAATPAPAAAVVVAPVYVSPEPLQQPQPQYQPQQPVSPQYSLALPVIASAVSVRATPQALTPPPPIPPRARANTAANASRAQQLPQPVQPMSASARSAASAYPILHEIEGEPDPEPVGEFEAAFAAAPAAAAPVPALLPLSLSSPSSAAALAASSSSVSAPQYLRFEPPNASPAAAASVVDAYAADFFSRDLAVDDIFQAPAPAMAAVAVDPVPAPAVVVFTPAAAPVVAAPIVAEVEGAVEDGEGVVSPAPVARVPRVRAPAAAVSSKRALVLA